MKKKLLLVPATVVLFGVPVAVATPADGESVEKLLRRAARQYEKGDLLEARALYVRADEAAGGRSLPAFQGLCEIALDRGQPDDAVRAGRRWIELAATPAEAAGGHRCLGIGLFHAALQPSRAQNGAAAEIGVEPLAAAADALRTAADHTTGDRGPILLDLADLLVRLGRREEAVGVLEEYRAGGGADSFAEQLRCWVEHERKNALATAQEPAPELAAPGSGPSLPVRVHSPPPQYPEELRAAGVEGVVILRALLDEEGRVTCARVLRGVEPALDRSTVETVRKWRFEPARLNGTPVPVAYNLSVNFSLAETVHLEGRRVGPYVVVREQ